LKRIIDHPQSPQMGLDLGKLAIAADPHDQFRSKSST
jgi:hypothetical protein